MVLLFFNKNEMCLCIYFAMNKKRFLKMETKIYTHIYICVTQYLFSKK